MTAMGFDKGWPKKSNLATSVLGTATSILGATSMIGGGAAKASVDEGKATTNLPNGNVVEQREKGNGEKKK